MRVLLQLRLLQARRDRIALARSIISHRITIDQALHVPDDATVLAQGNAGPRLKHLSLRGATTCW
jgi:hypothetical protein